MRAYFQNKNSNIINKHMVQGRGSHDIRYYDQLEAVKRAGALLFNEHSSNAFFARSKDKLYLK